MLNKQFTHKTKGGWYKIVVDGSNHSTIKGAGTLKGETIILYQDTDTGQIYARTKKDFFNSMETMDE